MLSWSMTALLLLLPFFNPFLFPTFKTNIRIWMYNFSRNLKATWLWSFEEKEQLTATYYRRWGLQGWSLQIYSCVLTDNFCNNWYKIHALWICVILEPGACYSSLHCSSFSIYAAETSVEIYFIYVYVYLPVCLFIHTHIFWCQERILKLLEQELKWVLWIGFW